MVYEGGGPFMVLESPFKEDGSLYLRWQLMDNLVVYYIPVPLVYMDIIVC